MLDANKDLRRRRVAVIKLIRRLPEMVVAIHSDIWKFGYGKTSGYKTDIYRIDDVIREATNISARINNELPSLFRSTEPTALIEKQFDEVYSAFQREWESCYAGLYQLRTYLEKEFEAPLKDGGTTPVPFSMLYQTVDIDQPKQILQMAAEQISECFPVDEAVEALQPAGVVIEEYIMGDVFKNISHATIINRSVVERAFNRYKDSSDDDVAVALKEIAQHVDASGNIAAAAVFNQFASTLIEEKPDKSKLGQYWDSLVAILPGVGSITGAASAIVKIFA
jgi:hypothetical protein